jgi:N-acetylneuraminate synthase
MRAQFLLATGASNLAEVTEAAAIFTERKIPLVIMQCNTNYTTNKDNHKHQNLRVLEQYKQLFPNVILGLSDHTQGDLAVLGS